ncbi:MAG: hypothetical protein ACTSR2_07295, partial [Candidatus Hodarchaeales archaeon]
AFVKKYGEEGIYNPAHIDEFLELFNQIDTDEKFSYVVKNNFKKALFLDLCQRDDLEDLLGNLYKHNVDVQHPLIHLASQALVKQYREKGIYSPGDIDNIGQLFDRFEREFSDIAASLKMYFYIDLTDGERVILNSTLVPRVSVE